MSEQRRLQRNKIFAQGIERTTTVIVRVGVDIFKALINFIKEMISTAIGRK